MSDGGEARVNGVLACIWLTWLWKVGELGLRESYFEIGNKTEDIREGHDNVSRIERKLKK